MRIVLLGGLFPKENESFFMSKGKNNFQVAADALQWELVDGFESVLGKKVNIVTAPFVGTYPRDYDDMWVRGFKFSREFEEENYSAGFLNLKVMSNFSRYFSCKRILEGLMSKFSRDEKVCIVVYGMFAYLLAAAVASKRTFSNLKVCLVVPDLPDMMGGDSSRLKIRLYNYFNGRALDRALRGVDGYVLLSKFMTERLPIEDRPWCVMEGIAKERERRGRTSDSKVISILYSGTLAKRYGVIDLLDAFRKIEGSHFRLWICGVGDGVCDVVAAAANDARIDYLGQVPREEVLALQERATLLVNPRTSIGDFTRYSFPSKILEYMSSGTPCIMHRLAGVPEEYFEHCIIPPSEDGAGLCLAILEAERMGRERLSAIGISARDFVAANKTAGKQCEKIVHLIDRL